MARYGCQDLIGLEAIGSSAVAGRLYISHTVNAHLQHVFAKLGVPNRVAPPPPWYIT